MSLLQTSRLIAFSQTASDSQELSEVLLDHVEATRDFGKAVSAHIVPLIPLPQPAMSAPQAMYQTSPLQD